MVTRPMNHDEIQRFNANPTIEHHVVSVEEAHRKFPELYRKFEKKSSGSGSPKQ